MENGLNGKRDKWLRKFERREIPCKERKEAGPKEA